MAGVVGVDERLFGCRGCFVVGSDPIPFNAKCAYRLRLCCLEGALSWDPQPPSLCASALPL